MPPKRGGGDNQRGRGAVAFPKKKACFLLWKAYSLIRENAKAQRCLMRLLSIRESFRSSHSIRSARRIRRVGRVIFLCRRREYASPGRRACPEQQPAPREKLCVKPQAFCFMFHSSLSLVPPARGVVNLSRKNAAPSGRRESKKGAPGFPDAPHSIHSAAKWKWGRASSVNRAGSRFFAGQAAEVRSFTSPYLSHGTCIALIIA